MHVVQSIILNDLLKIRLFIFHDNEDVFEQFAFILFLGNHYIKELGHKSAVFKSGHLMQLPQDLDFAEHFDEGVVGGCEVLDVLHGHNFESTKAFSLINFAICALSDLLYNLVFF